MELLFKLAMLLISLNFIVMGSGIIIHSSKNGLHFLILGIPLVVAGFVFLGLLCSEFIDWIKQSKNPNVIV